MGTDAREFARRYEDAYNRHDLGALGELCTEDLVEENPLGTLNGREAVLADMANLWDAYPDARVTFTNVIGDGDSYSIEWAFVGTGSGSRALMGTTMRVSGIILDLRGVSVGEFCDGRMRSIRQYYNVPTAVIAARAAAQDSR
jgi:hypothetical protein